MWIMILKMTAVTALYVVLTVLLWKSLQRRTMTAWLRLAVGVIYGGCAVLSTHFGVDYSHMMLNVRDLGPLSAGLFFDPVSGVIAGLIGGVERYIAGTYWGVGSYTRIACSVSTCLAGFLAAAVHVLIFKRRKPAAIYAFFMGAVMEVFHMYVVFITHRDDMSMAFYVVKTCAPPMIVFTGLGMAASAAALELCAGEWRNPFRRVSAEEIPVSRRFQLWLFGVALAVLALNLAFSFAVQTQTAVQGGRETLAAVSQDIRQTYEKLAQTGNNAVLLAEETARMEAQAVSEAVRRSGGVASAAADRAYLEQMRSIFGLVAVSAVDERGVTVASAGDPSVFSAPPDAAKLAIGEAPSAGGTIRVAVDVEALAAALNLSGLNEALSYFHVGSEGGFETEMLYYGRKTGEEDEP